MDTLENTLTSIKRYLAHKFNVGDADIPIGDLLKMIG